MLKSIESLLVSGKKALSGIILAAALTFSGGVQQGCCNTEYHISRVARERAESSIKEGSNYLALFDGLVGCELKYESHNLEVEGYVSAINANNPKDHMELIRQAHAQGRKIDLVGFSMGGSHVFDIAKECEKEGIPIRSVHTIDYAEKKHVPRNIRYIFQYKGTVPYLARCLWVYSEKDLSNPNTKLSRTIILEGAGHMECPSQARDIITQALRDPESTYQNYKYRN